MSNVIEFNDFSSSGDHKGELSCWLCLKAVTVRALFCHHCGTVQPVRALDHFARLGLERRVDLDAATIDRHDAAIRRMLDPERFAVRGLGERGHAARQLEALDEAYATLREPLRRGRYLLMLNSGESVGADMPLSPEVASLWKDLDAAAEPCVCDRVATRAGQALQTGIFGFMQALRGGNWNEATERLADLDALETILSGIRDRRATLVPSGAGAGSVVGIIQTDA